MEDGPAKILNGLLKELDTISNDDFAEKLRSALERMTPEQVRRLSILCKPLIREIRESEDTKK